MLSPFSPGNGLRSVTYIVASTTNSMGRKNYSLNCIKDGYCEQTSGHLNIYA